MLKSGCALLSAWALSFSSVLERSVLGVEAPITKLVATCRLISETQTFTLKDLARKRGRLLHIHTN